MNPKPWYQSKTLWFNVFTMLVLIAEQIPALWPNPPEWLTVAVGAVLVVGNVILRVWFTSEPLYVKQ